MSAVTVYVCPNHPQDTSGSLCLCVWKDLSVYASSESNLSIPILKKNE